MKKLFIASLVALMSLSAFAEQGTMILTSPPAVQLLAVSPNGKWACGISGDGITSTEKGVLWNLETGELTYLSTSGSSTAYDVADDGTVVGSGGYYKDGSWHRYDNSTIPGVGGGTVMSISRDARCAVGYVMQGGVYSPAKWEDGKLKLIYPFNNQGGQCYTISDDGKYASGWDYTTTGNAPLNRTIALWTDSTVQYLSPRATFAEAGRRFSPDNSKLVCESMGQKFVYDLNTQEKTFLPFYAFTLSGSYVANNQLVCYVNNDGLVLGGEEIINQSIGASDAVGYVYDGEKARSMVEWLNTEYGVVIDENKYKIYRGVEMSNDGKVIAMLANLLDNGAYTGDYVSIIVALDREVDVCPPVTLRGEKMRGVNKVRLTWKEPVMNAENVLGYNIYRDGEVVVEAVSEMAYIDDVVVEGDYTYTVTALYEGEGDEFVESEPSVAVSVAVYDEPINGVTSIVSHIYNYNDLKLRWGVPESNLPAVTYYDYDANAAGFGGGLTSFSAAIRMPFDIVDNYAGNHVIARVAFMPRNAEARYTVKVIVNGVERASQLVDNAVLSYNNMNIIDLTTPVELSEGDDVLVAIDIDASAFTAASNDVIGMCYGEVVTGFSDLLRQFVEPAYYSLNQSSIDAGYGEMPVCWAISAVLAELGEDGKPNVMTDVVAGYDVYRDENLLATVNELSYMDTNVSQGMHTYAIAARYADGSVAEATPYRINFVPRSEALVAIDEVKISADNSSVEATWNAPLNNDATVISYSNGRDSGKGIVVSGAVGLIEYTVAHEYPFSYFEWYEGYKIEALRFYPSSEAIFAIVLDVNGIDHEMVVLGEMGAEDGYTLNKWNVVHLNEPYVIKSGDKVMVKLICSEVDPSTYPITFDTGRGISGVSDLYSFDYTKFSSAQEDGGTSGSWMLGMLISNDNTEMMPVSGYNVFLDGEAMNDELIQETSFSKTDCAWRNGETHRLRVNVVYNIDDKSIEVEGEQQIFTITAGVESIEVDRVKVYPNPAASYVTVEGAVERMLMVDMSGRTVAEAAVNTIDVTSLPVGNYILNVYSNGAVRSVKVVVVR